MVPGRWVDEAAAAAAVSSTGYAQVEAWSLQGRRMLVHLYRPPNFDARRGRIWFVMHGVKREAARVIETAMPVAREYGVLAITLEFSRADYPASASYTLGLRPPGTGAPQGGRAQRYLPLDQLPYNEVERTFDLVGGVLGTEQRGYYLFGHSAGAQFVSRLLTFHPCPRVLSAVAANAGWYTLPTEGPEGHAFPYSLRRSPFAADVPRLLAQPLHLLLGTQDVAAPGEDADLRGTRGAMAQGSTRVERGENFFATGRRRAAELGVPFGWSLHFVPGAGHHAEQMIGDGGRLLFAPAGANPPGSAR